MPDAVAVFLALPTPAPGGSGLRFAAQPLPGYAAYRIAKDVEARPALLVATPTGGATGLLDYALENLEVVHGAQCAVAHPNGAQEQRSFSLIRCTSPDATVHDHFLRSLASIVAAVGDAPTAGDISRGVGKLIELFRLMRAAPREPVQGLWAELFLLAEARDPEALARSWHTTFVDVFDFNQGAQRIEVKSAAGQQRVHHFGLGQLMPPPGTEVLIASMLVQRAATGPSVADLAAEVRARVAGVPELVLRIDQVTAEALGNDWRAAEQTRFDRAFARQSLAFYRADDVPKVDPALPHEVTDVHFRADLAGASPEDPTCLQSAGGIFAAAIRQSA